MAWARLDDRYCFHRKVLAAGNEAAGAHVRMIAYACLEGTDGVIAAGTASIIAGTTKVLDRLVAAVLLERLESGDFRIHDFLDYNPPAAELRAKREVATEQRRAAGKRSAEVRAARRSSNGTGNDSLNGSLSGSFNEMGNETPTPYPYPYSEEKEENPPTPLRGANAVASTKPSRSKRTTTGTRIVADWKPSPATLETFRADGVDAPACVAEFVDFWAGVPDPKGRKVDWDATFRNRVRQLVAAGRAPTLSPAARLRPVPPAPEDALDDGAERHPIELPPAAVRRV